MLNDISYAEMESGEEPIISEFVKKVFEEFVAPDFSPDGIETFMVFISPDSIRKRNQNKEKNFLIAARDNKMIIGIIEIKNCNHISLLFVDKLYQKTGIAKKLYGMALKRCKESIADLKEFEVNSSRFAVPMYRKLGFEKIGEEQIKDGILFTPMKANV
jgi:GNAT superfamily N-acetyltransferase